MADLTTLHPIVRFVYTCRNCGEEYKTFSPYDQDSFCSDECENSFKKFNLEMDKATDSLHEPL